MALSRAENEKLILETFLGHVDGLAAAAQEYGEARAGPTTEPRTPEEIKKNTARILTFALGEERRYRILHQAAEQGHTPILNYMQEMLEQMVLISLFALKDNRGRTPLVIAVEHGNLEFVQTAIQFGADVSRRGAHGESLLHIAVAYHSVACLQYLLDRSLHDLDHQADNGETPLMRAIMFHGQESVGALLQRRANLNLRNSNGNTALHLSMLARFQVGATMIMNGGGDEHNPDYYPNVQIQNKNGATALHLAVESKDLDLYRKFDEWSVDAMSSLRNINGQVPLHQAILTDQWHMAQHLISRMEDIDVHDIDVTDNEGVTPLHLAFYKAFQPCIRRLLQLHADPRRTDNVGNTVWHFAVLSRGAADILSVAQECSGAHVNDVNFDGDTALHLAVRAGQPHVVQNLIDDYNADRTLRNLVNESPLDAAYALPDFEPHRAAIVAMLLERGV